MSGQDDYSVFKKQELCIQEEAPYCTGSCPLGVDARAMLRQIMADKLESAYSDYRKRVIFAKILSRICRAPCQSACLRKDFGDPIQIRLLEQACAEHAGDKPLPKIFIPAKNAAVHVVGGSLAGLACANTLARKGFTVHIHEKTGRLGGRLWAHPADQLPPELIAEDIGQNLNFSQLHTHLETEITALAAFPAEDFVFVACAAEPAFFNRQNVFFLKDYPEAAASPAHEILAGKQAAAHVEQAFKGEPPASWPVSPPTRLVVPNPDAGQNRQAVAPGSGGGYTRSEAVQEAARCLQCQCLECTKFCLLLKNNKSYPKVYINHAQQSLRTLNQLHRKIAARRTNACNLCGLCGEICPNGLDMGEVYLKSRRIMHADGQLPEAFHEFWLRDMAFARSDAAALCRAQSGHEKSAYMFFPGCQMGGSLPEYVSDTYRYLCAKLAGGVALSVDCCGAPSEWAGYAELTRPIIESFKKDWEALGRPKVILACPSCKKMFNAYHAEIPTLSLWTVLGENPPQVKAPAEAGKIALFDPCSSRYNPEEQQSIRKLLQDMGCALEELPLHGRLAQCCGYGGMIYASNPELADEIRSDRISAGELPYVTYCVNCREVFAGGGKKVWHILDLLFGGAERAGQKPPDWSTRRANRIRLKKQLLQEFWMEDAQRTPEPFESITLIIPQELSEKMEKDLITADDIKQVVYQAEQSGKKLIYENGHILAYSKLYYSTYWVEYQPDEKGFLLHNAYSHRMALTERQDG